MSNLDIQTDVREVKKVFQNGTYFAGGKVLMCSGRRKKRRPKKTA